MVKASEGRNLHAELERLPEHLVGEIVEGNLVVSPRPAPRHTLASSSIGSDLLGAFGRGGGGSWWILDEPELHLGSDVLVPDIGGWRRDRMPALPGEAYFTLAPDWVCEILSPRTAALDRARKMPIYARESVPHLWLVDPLVKTLEVYLRQGSSWLLHAVHQGADIVHVPPFEAAALELAAWWPPEPDPEPEPEPEPDSER